MVAKKTKKAMADETRPTQASVPQGAEPQDNDDGGLSALGARLAAMGDDAPEVTGADTAKLKRSALSESFRAGNGAIKAHMKRIGEYQNSKNR
jgi:hypothetical protein